MASRRGLLPALVDGTGDHSSRTRFGIALSKMQDRVVSGYRIRMGIGDTHAKVRTYRLEPTFAGAAGARGALTPAIPGDSRLNDGWDLDPWDGDLAMDGLEEASG